MCGIYGIIGLSDRKLLERMSKGQSYRGPDEKKFEINKKYNFSIGMNRLAVIDKKLGSQPMFSYNKRFLLVFNGAIYNFKEVRKLLENKINFKTNSDTEVLINAYSIWGTKCFNLFDGMWATAIYDFEKKKTILSRDPVGQKPLFYFTHKNKLIFSSQLNGIFEYDYNFKFSDRNLNEYFKFNHYPSPITPYEKIYQVNPGEIIEFKNNKLNKKKYWDISKGPNYNILFKKNKSADFKNIFTNLTKNFTIADKNAGLCLSSGIDSQILKIFLRKVKKKIISFTIGFDEKSYDESKLIESTRNNSNTKKILKDQDFIKIFNKIKKNIFFPFGDASIIPTYALYEIVKKKTNVALSGDGGDELYFGYEAQRGFYLLKIIRQFIPKIFLFPLKIIFSKLNFSTKYLGIKKKLYFFSKFINTDLYDVLRSWISNFDQYNEMEYFKKVKKNSIFSSYLQKIYLKKNYLKFSQLYFFKFYLPVILMKVDFSSMLNSVESRAPYLSKDMINFVLDIDCEDNFRFF